MKRKVVLYGISTFFNRIMIVLYKILRLLEQTMVGWYNRRSGIPFIEDLKITLAVLFFLLFFIMIFELNFRSHFNWVHETSKFIDICDGLRVKVIYLQ